MKNISDSIKVKCCSLGCTITVPTRHAALSREAWSLLCDTPCVIILQYIHVCVASSPQSREWVTHSDPWPKWPIELLTHDPCDPRSMGHRGRHPILAQALHRFIDYPALYLDIVYVHTPLSCYTIAHVSKLHTQAPVYRCIDIIIL